MLVGYARVSSVGQSLDVQLEALSGAGCDKVFSEKASGRSAKGRGQLGEALDFVREGDTLVVTRLDRLARSVGDLFGILETLRGKGASFQCLNQSGVNMDSSTGRLMLGVLGAVAAFEADIRKERQAEGIARAKAEGRYKGRPPSVDAARVHAMKGSGTGASEIAKALGISRASVYRALAEGSQAST